MENSIVREFQNLHVLKTYDFEKMDELVQDLTNALEETARPQKSKFYDNTYARRQYKKKKSRKRRTNGGRDGGNLSEASESSLDEALKDYMENIFQQSDSDEVATAHRLSSLPLSNLTHALSLESDSVTENFSPMKLHRRKRKCKRMAVDPQPDPNFLLPTLKPKFIRMRSKIKTLETRTDNVMETNSNDASNSESTSCGQNPGDSGGYCNSMETHSVVNNTLEASSSSLSSSESDCGAIGIFTDEGRDGDDEQSDFFHEGGPSCGIPGIIAWWENEKCGEGLSSAIDPKFQNLLSGSFDYMPSASQKSFKARVTKLLAGREFRSARRRFKEKTQRYSKLRCKQSGADACLPEDWTLAMSPPTQSDIKRRRRTPPSTPAKEGYVGEDAEPIPESNIGQKMMQSMGWVPGSGLGPSSSGITTPVMAYLRPKRKGFGSTFDNQ